MCGFVEDLWQSFRERFTVAGAEEEMHSWWKIYCQSSALGRISNPESDSRNEIWCEIFQSWNFLLCLSSFSPSVCLSHFYTDCSLISPPSQYLISSTLSPSVLQGVAQHRFSKRLEQYRRWGESHKVENTKHVTHF